MNRVVLVVLGRPEAARASLDAAAIAAARLGGARIVGMTVRIDPRSTVIASEEVLTDERRAEIERQSDALLAMLRGEFDAWKAAHGGDTEWIETEGSVEDEVAHHGRAVELLVTSAASGPQDKTGTALHAALLDTQRPVLVVPDVIGPTIGRHVAIAWHDDEPAARAALSAMPFIAAAEQVSVLQGGRAGAKPPAVPSLFTEHRIAAEVRLVAAGRRDMGRALLAEAHAIGADLLVMGAFAHSRFFEAVLGGVTRTMLHAADIPLLMRH